ISMVWTFGMLALRKADLGDFYAEFFRFTVFTGFFWWLLTNGPRFATDIMDSLRTLGGMATGTGATLTPSGIVDIGFDIFFRVLDKSSILSPVDSAVGILLSAAILIILALIGVNMLVLLVSGWILSYAGVFFLGFGGSRWTSDMAIGYYRTVLALGAQLAAMILLTIFLIVTFLFIENSTLIAMNGDASWAFRPFAAMLAPIFGSSVYVIHEIAFWVHILLILAFMNYLPFSKHLHVLTSVLNVFFSNLGPTNKLDTIDFEDESNEKFGVSDVEDFKWKTLLDGYTCTHCGRCTSVCPANITGKVLDPREVVIQIRERTMDKMPILAKDDQSQITEAEQAKLDKKFIGEYQNIEALWQCTTCGACMQECPVNIEHVPAIIEMRRSLVMMDAEFPDLLQTTFGNMENNASPWAFSQAERADWAEGKNIDTAAEKQDFDILFWVGCAGSFDDRAKKVSVAFSELMQKAGVNFAILGTEEQCNGDVARRTGNEYLADMMVKANIETLNQYNFKKIVATCPHCFNTFKNEYPMFGATYEVIHHTQFIMDLIKDGKLSLKDSATDIESLTYHDSCYMGRYNDVYDEPRNSLLSVPGLNIKETARNKDKGLCCGAGGGQMFLEETKGKRVNIERTEELLETGAKTIAVNCPFCMTMISDGVKAKDVEDVKVKDVSEIILESLK
ncbi:MAG: P-type conjugative transfer protein TrbL, partial [Candidatus Kapabacteria bacterium]|nr:P-type conjugative transfer protein TrbL [Candidatus Kapabacteria bacterium]